MTPKANREQRRPHDDHGEGVRPVIEKSRALRWLDAGQTQRYPDEVRQKRPHHQRPSRSFRGLGLYGKRRRKMGSVHQSEPRRKVLINERIVAGIMIKRT